VSAVRNERMVAVATELHLFPGASELTGRDEINAGKALLVRATGADRSDPGGMLLRPLATERAWQIYADHRVEVEAEFGVAAADARRMVDELRARCANTAMDMFAAQCDHTIIGAIGRFRMPPPDHHWARLQEVDIFPTWRGYGYGTAMLLTMLGLLAREGATMVVVGADEDDWPLTWYRRHGFSDVARVRKAQ